MEVNKTHKNTTTLDLYGLIGYPLGHSFSQQYFTQKFQAEGIENARYELFPLKKIKDLRPLLREHPDLRGLNVTIPYKEAVLPYLYRLDPVAQAVGAANVIRIKNGQMTGFNTDVIGLEQSLLKWLSGHGVRLEPAGLPEAVLFPLDGPAPELPSRVSALILGTGGAAKAVAYVLRKMGIPHCFVSRRPGSADRIGYGEIAKHKGVDKTLIFNTTPLGTYPNTESCPEIPFDEIGPNYLVYDLVYNPPETLLLQRAKARGAAIKNGLEMLHIQADAAWSIWQQS